MDILVIFKTMIKLLLLLLLGYLLNKVSILDQNTSKKLSSLIVNVTTPLLILSSVCANSGGDRLSVLPVLGAGFLMYLGLILFGELAARLPVFKKENRGINACMMVFSNNAFMGIPVLQSIYGIEAIFYNSIINFPYNIFIYSYAVLRLNSKSGEGKNKIKFKSMLTPGFILMLLCLVIFLTGIPLPELAVESCEMVGSITSPLSMLVLGATVAMYPLKSSLKDIRCYVFSLFRLLIIPLIVLLVCRGLQIDPFYTGIAVLSCAMPVGSMVLMIANQYGGDTETISRNILVTTVLSVVTIPLVAAILTM